MLDNAVTQSIAHFKADIGYSPSVETNFPFPLERAFFSEASGREVLTGMVSSLQTFVEYAD